MKTGLYGIVRATLTLYRRRTIFSFFQYFSSPNGIKSDNTKKFVKKNRVNEVKLADCSQGVPRGVKKGLLLDCTDWTYVPVLIVPREAAVSASKSSFQHCHPLRYIMHKGLIARYVLYACVDAQILKITFLMFYL